MQASTSQRVMRALGILTGEKTASEYFLERQKEVKGRGLDIEIDSLVSAVSFIWSVFSNKGQLLANRDLLRGDKIRPMALELAKRWTDIHRAVLKELDAVKTGTQLRNR